MVLRINQLRGELPTELGNLANLQTLSLFSNQLTGEIPAELGNLVNLEGLFLFGNQLTGEIPAALGNLANLQSLSLSVNQLTSEIPAELGNLTNLEGLFLRINQLTGEIPVELGNLTSLEDLFLNDNHLMGPIPGELSDLTNLSDGSGLTLHSNHVYTDSNTLRDFLNTKSSSFGDWESTQTLNSYFAQFANGVGLSSQIVLFNLNDRSAATGQLQILDDPGSDLAVDLNGEMVNGIRDVSVPAAGLLTLRTDGMGDLQTGSVRLTTDRHVEGVVIFGGGVGLAGVGSSPKFPSGFAAPMQKNEAGGLNTGIAVTSLSEQDDLLDLTLLDSAGVTLASASDPLVAHGHKALFVDEIGWDSVVDFSDFSGTLEVSSQQPLTATVLQTRPGVRYLAGGRLSAPSRPGRGDGPPGYSPARVSTLFCPVR